MLTFLRNSIAFVAQVAARISDLPRHQRHFQQALALQR